MLTIQVFVKALDLSSLVKILAGLSPIDGEVPKHNEQETLWTCDFEMYASRRHH